MQVVEDDDAEDFLDDPPIQIEGKSMKDLPTVSNAELSQEEVDLLNQLNAEWRKTFDSLEQPVQPQVSTQQVIDDLMRKIDEGVDIYDLMDELKNLSED